MEDFLLTSGKLAEAADCQLGTVYKYDKLDLLKPVARDSAGRRLYEPRQVLVLRKLKAKRIANRGFARRA
jgi:DNA-binding transcriptional MerR regulator